MQSTKILSTHESISVQIVRDTASLTPISCQKSFDTLILSLRCTNDATNAVIFLCKSLVIVSERT